MLFRYLKISGIALMLAFIVATAFSPFRTSAITDNVLDGVDETVEVADGIDPGIGSAKTAEATSFFTKRIGKMVGAVLAFVGVLFLVLMIYGGLMWMTALGNDSQVEKARNVIVASVIGLIIVLAAYAITAFLGNKLTS